MAGGDAFWLPVPSGGGGFVAADRSIRTSGHISFSSVAWADVDTGLDLALGGVAAGDWVGVSLSARFDNEARETYVDCCSVVAGSPVNYWGGTNTGTHRGVQSWCGVISRVEHVGGTAWKELVSGDIDAGALAIRLRARNHAAGAKTIGANADIPLLFSAVAHRP